LRPRIPLLVLLQLHFTTFEESVRRGIQGFVLR
jgi:hypothetical protein